MAGTTVDRTDFGNQYPRDTIGIIGNSLKKTKRYRVRTLHRQRGFHQTRAQLMHSDRGNTVFMDLIAQKPQYRSYGCF